VEKMKFHHFCPPYENPWLHLENSTIAPLGTQRLINHRQLVKHSALIKYAIKSIFGDLRWNMSLAYTSKAWLT